MLEGVEDVRTLVPVDAARRPDHLKFVLVPLALLNRGQQAPRHLIKR